MLTNKGYSFQVDIWAIGICLYEFICGMVPFGEQSNSPYDIFEEIIKKKVYYPNYMKDEKARLLME